MILRAAALICLLAVPLGAQSIPDQARAATDALQTATETLREAQGGRPRVRALTDAIRAVETGLTAIRETQRQTTTREQVLAAKLNARDAETAVFLGSLQAVGRADSPTVFLHPDGAAGTVRAAMLLSEIGPVLNARAASLRAEVTELRDLQALQAAAARTLQQSLEELQTARDSLNTAIANRETLPQRFTLDPVREAILLASTETLTSFADGVLMIAEEGSEKGAPDNDLPLGDLPLPALGVLLRDVGEADLAGIARPGIVLATRPQALVSAPSTATIRYAGPLLDFDQVVILEPRAGSLIILAGLAQSYGTAGDLIAAGDPVGIMGKNALTTPQAASTGGEGAATDLSETLYIEVRQDNAPVDPKTWFALGKERQESK